MESYVLVKKRKNNCCLIIGICYYVYVCVCVCACMCCVRARDCVCDLDFVVGRYNKEA